MFNANLSTCWKTERKIPELASSYPIADPLHSFWNDSSDVTTGIFGLPFSLEDSAVALIPVPWEAACSQGVGTAKAPAMILEASRYVELHDLDLGNIYEQGIAMAQLNPVISQLINQADAMQPEGADQIKKLDALSDQLFDEIAGEVATHLAAGRSVGLIGGDHSVSAGAIAAHHEVFPQMGVLQIDAHADLRPSLDGLSRSHASVMYHVMEQINPVSLTQVGIRAICGLEVNYLNRRRDIHLFSDSLMQRQIASGQSWMAVCDQIVDTLPEVVYLSLDIDGLDPAFCPHTGTPVPGGLTFNQLTLLLHRVIESGRTFCGFDLVEVGASEQDALIAAHLLYQLCGFVGRADSRAG